jgi:hypothetical protein
MKFICLGYHDESSWDRKSKDERQRFMHECFEYDEELRRGGHVLGGEALDSVQNPLCQHSCRF